MPERSNPCARHAPRTLCGALLAAISAVAAAADAPPPPGYEIQCLEETSGKKLQYCFAPSKLVVEGTTRSSPLFTGAGTDLAKTAFVIVADCRKTTLAVKDANGAAAKGAPSLKAATAKELAADMCAAKMPAPAPASKPATAPAPTPAPAPGKAAR